MRLDWIAADRVAAMGAPWPEELPVLAQAGVTAIVSLTTRIPEGVVERFDHLHLPVRDFTPPSQKQLSAGVQFMDRAIEGGGKVVVHCGAGLGRTGTLIAAWFVRHGDSPADAIRRVRAARPGSIETRDQEQAIGLFSRIGNEGSDS